MTDGGAQVAEVLLRQGVRYLFTLCGGHISPILVGAKARGIGVVDVRHEANAVFAADATGRLTGIPGVAAVTAGPGVTNSLTALQNARAAQSPLVLLGGAAPTILRGRGALQDVDQLAMIRPHVKWARAARRVRDLVPLLEEAFRASVDGVPGPVFLECPIDLLYPEAMVRSWYGKEAGGGRGLGARLKAWYVGRHLDRLFGDAEGTMVGDPGARPRSRPWDLTVDRAARLVRQAERPALVVGSQAVSDPGEVPALAEAILRLGIPTWLSGMARGLLGAESPLLRRHARKQALREADLVILAGAPCDFRLGYGAALGPGASLVAANLELGDLFRNRIPRVPAWCAPASLLVALAGCVPGPQDRWKAWAERSVAADASRDAEIRELAARPGEHVDPLAACLVLDRVMGEAATIIGDGGDFVATASYVLRPRGPLGWLDPGVFGTLGVGAGFAMAAALARPRAETWLLYGDGAAGFSLAEFDTFVRHRLPVVAVVGNDASWSQIARDQVTNLGDDVGTRLAATDYDRVVEGFGAAGFRVETTEALEPALRAARRVADEGRPALVNVRLRASEFRQGSLSV